MTRPRIALFTPYFPAPAFTGGRARISHFARALSAWSELDLFAKAPPREAHDARALHESHCYARVHSAPAEFAWPSLWTKRYLPRRVRTANPARLQRLFREQHARQPYQLVVVEHAHAATAAISCDVPWLLDEHNIESEYLEAKLRAAAQLRLWQRPELRALRRWEARCWREASEVVAVTPQDAARIAAVRGRPALHIPNGVSLADVPFTPPGAREQARTDILFVGLMDHPPNVHAAHWLVAAVMPKVWAVRPEARLVLCGANPKREVSTLAGMRVLVTGRVPRVQPFLARAGVFANAVAFGGGSSLKVLEALAAGLPLVSTRAGVRGFDLRDGEHYLAADAADDFAEAVLAGLDGNYAQRALRAAAGRRFAEAHAWDALAGRFTAVAQRMIGVQVTQPTVSGEARTADLQGAAASGDEVRA